MKKTPKRENRLRYAKNWIKTYSELIFQNSKEFCGAASHKIKFQPQKYPLLFLQIVVSRPFFKALM